MYERLQNYTKINLERVDVIFVFHYSLHLKLGLILLVMFNLRSQNNSMGIEHISLKICGSQRELLISIVLHLPYCGHSKKQSLLNNFLFFFLYIVVDFVIH